MPGNVRKDTRYLELIKKATLLDLFHPRHHNIKMQAHHAVSAEGVRLSAMGPALVRFQYDINRLLNLVFIPSTLQGACHLGIQPHRGDHTAVLLDVDGEDDDEIPDAYHKMVKRRVKTLARQLDGKCPRTHPNLIGAVELKMDEISRDIIRLLEKSPERFSLTWIAAHFDRENPTGCGGVDSVPKHGNAKCPVARNHHMQEGKSQRHEGITYKSPRKYHLKAGR